MVLMSEMVDNSGKSWRTRHRMVAGAGEYRSMALHREVLI